MITLFIRPNSPSTSLLAHTPPPPPPPSASHAHNHVHTYSYSKDCIPHRRQVLRLRPLCLLFFSFFFIAENCIVYKQMLHLFCSFITRFFRILVFNVLNVIVKNCLPLCNLFEINTHGLKNDKT